MTAPEEVPTKWGSGALPPWLGNVGIAGREGFRAATVASKLGQRS